MKRDPSQRMAAKVLMLEWRMICLRFGSQAATNFMRIYAKLGLEKAFQYKHMLEKEENDRETLDLLIKQTNEKLVAIFGGENERLVN